MAVRSNLLKIEGRMEPSDKELIAGIASRDQGAFAALYDRHAPRILSLLVRWLRDRGDADDILQDSFWYAWNNARQFDESRGSLVGWLVQIARSRATDLLRRRNRTGAFPVNGELKEMLEPSSRIVWDEGAMRLRSALNALPDEQRGTILLAYFAGLTHDEIARWQQSPLGTVKTRIRLGMRRLSEMLANDGGEVDR